MENIFDKAQLAEKEKADKRHQILVLESVYRLHQKQQDISEDLQKDSKFAKAFQAFAMVPLGATLLPLCRLDFSLSDTLLAKFGPKK